MIESILVCLLFIIMAITLINGFFKIKNETKEVKRIEKEMSENAEKTADVISDANKTKADARTGDHSADIKYMADKLRDYNNK